jgi:hypothetical protein
MLTTNLPIIYSKKLKSKDDFCYKILQFIKVSHPPLFIEPDCLGICGEDM